MYDRNNFRSAQNVMDVSFFVVFNNTNMHQWITMNTLEGSAELERLWSGWGLRAGKGEFQLPHTHSSLFLTPSLSLLPKNGTGGPRRISISGRSPHITSGGIVPHHSLLPWNKVSPQIPLSLPRCLVFRFWGDACCSCDFRPNLCKSRV